MIKFDVINRFSKTAQFTAEINCDENAPDSVKLGLAVQWGVNIGANLREANLRGANLSRADLTGANLSKADLTGANLSKADLSEADLSEANLRGANLSRADLSEADLSGADLGEANLYEADLTGANLTGASLIKANLIGANLSGADLHGADIDFSAWPLWCGSLSVEIDDRLAKQLVYHALAVAREHLPEGALTQELVDFANGFYRVGEVPKLPK